MQNGALGATAFPVRGYMPRWTPAALYLRRSSSCLRPRRPAGPTCCISICYDSLASLSALPFCYNPRRIGDGAQRRVRCAGRFSYSSVWR